MKLLDNMYTNSTSKKIIALIELNMILIEMRQTYQEFRCDLPVSLHLSCRSETVYCSNRTSSLIDTHKVTRFLYWLEGDPAVRTLRHSQLCLNTQRAACGLETYSVQIIITLCLHVRNMYRKSEHWSLYHSLLQGRESNIWVEELGSHVTQETSSLHINCTGCAGCSFYRVQYSVHFEHIPDGVISSQYRYQYLSRIKSNVKIPKYNI